jgi:glycosyltransferase involved in cell wall biosynthesis
LYGVGDFEDELKSICRLWKNVKYFGSLPNDYIVKEQIKSTLLTNPRPTHDEYTKYSFPSKIMEYMASGTPTLTTRLPGIPSEYYEHMYLIEDESTIGITKCLKALLLKDTSELHLKGSRAKQFVLTFKNNLLQAKKIINFCKIDHSRL